MKFKLNYTNSLKTKVSSYNKLYLNLGKLAVKALKITANTEVSVTIIDDLAIQKVNFEFRKINKPTDVLSFPNYNPNQLQTKLKTEKEVYLGDILISYPKAKVQAKEYSHSLKREMAFLYVHGLLHLFGYDHKTKQLENKMFKLQEQILDQAKIKR